MQGYFACNLLPSLRISHGKYCAVIIFVILPAFSFCRNYIYGRRNFVSANKRWRECDRDQSFFCFHIYIISCFEKLSDASCWGRKISFSKEIKWVMRVIAQDVRLCLRHAELSLARGFGSRDGGMGRASERGREWGKAGMEPGSGLAWSQATTPLAPFTPSVRTRTHSALNTCQENAAVCFEAAT